MLPLWPAVAAFVAGHGCVAKSTGVTCESAVDCEDNCESSYIPACLAGECICHNRPIGGPPVVMFPLARIAAVQVGETFLFFPDERDPVLDEPVGGCSVTWGSDYVLVDGKDQPVPETVLANFQRVLSEDYFSIQIQEGGDFVLWGLYDWATGKEWSSRPGGELTAECRYIGITEVVGLRCFFRWTGEAVENRTSEIRPAVADVECVFAIEPICTITCQDENDCTYDSCVNGECVNSGEWRQGRTCRLRPGANDAPPDERVGRCTADAECVELPPEMQL